jgi:hypothetical protein
MAEANRRLGTVTVLSVIVMISGVIVTTGWVLDIKLLQSILPVWVTMKFTTAISFILSGAVILCLALHIRKKGSLPGIFLPVLGLCILLQMATLFASSILGIDTGIEELFVREAQGAVRTATPGKPSLATMIEFILIAVMAFLALFGSHRFYPTAKWVGALITIVGIVGVLGYATNLPLLFYSIPDFSTAMACHTAVLFILCGIAIHLLGNCETKT